MPRPAMSGRGAVDGLEQSAACLGAQRGGRQQPQGARQHRRLVGENVAEHVFGDDHVEIARPPQQVHRGRIHQHVLEAHVRKFAGSMRSTTARHRREVSSTFALSTEVSLRRRARASCAARRTTRSISATL